MKELKNLVTVTGKLVKNNIEEWGIAGSPKATKEESYELHNHIHEKTF